MAPEPEIKIELCSDEDIPVCFEVMSKGFGHNEEFLDMYFPAHDTETGRVMGTKRLLAWKQDPAGSVFLKAVTQANPGQHEQIIGFAVWTHMREPPSPDLEKYEDIPEVWPGEDDREYMLRLWKEYVVLRGQAIRDSNGAGTYVLELLVVHPDFHRRGAGTALVKWGTAEADKQGLKAVVEGTLTGRKTYEGSGFHAVVERMRFDVGERFESRRKPVLIFMQREPKQ